MSNVSNDRPFLNCEDHLDFSKAYKWLMRRTELTCADKLIYTRLRNCSYSMGEYWVSLDYLSYECGVGKATVKRSLERLIKAGLISKTQHGKKMFNSYKCHIHEWMVNDDKFNKCESSKCAPTKSEGSKCIQVTAQNEPSIYKEQNKKQIYIVGSTEPTSQDELVEKRMSIFWTKWPRKSEGKKDAMDILKKVSVAEFKKIMDGLEKYINFISITRKNGFDRDYMSVSKFLNQKKKRYLESWEEDKKSTREKTSQQACSAWE
jgi:hypothetical protein